MVGYGYKKGDTGELEIKEEEAKVGQEIYDLKYKENCDIFIRKKNSISYGKRKMV